jgi:hypothetical protein
MNSIMQRRKTCDRVKSCWAHIVSTVASIFCGRRKPVDGSDSFNFVLLLAVDNRVYDVIFFNDHFAGEAGR